MNRLISLALIALAVILFFAYTDPTYTTSVKGLQTEMTSLDNALIAAARFEETKNNLLSKREEMSPEDLERIETLLPESVDSIGLVLDLDALVRRNGLQIAKVIIGDVSKKTSEGEGAIVEASAAATPLESSTISISVVGTYANIKNFLRSIESSLRAVDIVSLSLPKSDTGVYEATLTLRAYWVEKQKIPALESANTSDATIL